MPTTPPVGPSPILPFQRAEQLDRKLLLVGVIALIGAAASVAVIAGLIHRPPVDLDPRKIVPYLMVVAVANTLIGLTALGRCRFEGEIEVKGAGRRYLPTGPREIEAEAKSFLEFCDKNRTIWAEGYTAAQQKEFIDFLEDRLKSPAAPFNEERSWQLFCTWCRFIIAFKRLAIKETQKSLDFLRAYLKADMIDGRMGEDTPDLTVMKRVVLEATRPCNRFLVEEYGGGRAFMISLLQHAVFGLYKNFLDKRAKEREGHTPANTAEKYSALTREVLRLVVLPALSEEKPDVQKYLADFEKVEKGQFEEKTRACRSHPIDTNRKHHEAMGSRITLVYPDILSAMKAAVTEMTNPEGDLSKTAKGKRAAEKMAKTAQHVVATDKALKERMPFLVQPQTGTDTGAGRLALSSMAIGEVLREDAALSREILQGIFGPLGLKVEQFEGSKARAVLAGVYRNYMEAENEESETKLKEQGLTPTQVQEQVNAWRVQAQEVSRFLETDAPLLVTVSDWAIAIPFIVTFLRVYEDLGRDVREGIQATSGYKKKSWVERKAIDSFPDRFKDGAGLVLGIAKRMPSLVVKSKIPHHEELRNLVQTLLGSVIQGLVTDSTEEQKLNAHLDRLTKFANHLYTDLPSTPAGVKARLQEAAKHLRTA